MKKQLVTFSLIIVFLITGGLGCKGLSQEEQQSIQPVTLNYWTVFDDVEQLRSFAAAYQQLRPYVRINVRQVRYEEFDRLFANALADGVGPDIVSMHVRWLNKYQTRLSTMPPSVTVSKVEVKGSLSPQTIVTPEIISLPSINTLRSAYVSTVLDDVVLGGSVYGLPLSIDTLILYYNKDLLDKSGVPLAPTNWNEFTDAVKEATKFNAAGDIVQSGVALGTANNIENAFDIVSLLMMQNGITMSEGNAVRFAEGLQRPNAELPAFEALRFYTDFARPTQDVYSWNAGKGDALQEFIRGTTVFYFGYAFDKSRIRTGAPQMNLNVMPVPQLNQAVPVNVANYWVESVVSASQNQDIAWDFVRFMASQDNVRTYTEKTGQPSPFRNQIAEQQQNPDLAPFALQALTARNWYHGKDVEAADVAFGTMVSSFLEPLGDTRDILKLQAQAIQRAAQVVQQTY